MLIIIIIFIIIIIVKLCQAKLYNVLQYELYIIHTHIHIYSRNCARIRRLS